MDDDYFLCLDVFLHQLPMPARSLYHWGYLHCVRNLVRPEESIILLSKDVIDLFLGQDPFQMLCHPFADQAVAVWKQQLNLPDFYRGDSRLHHDPPASFLKKFQTLSNLCHSYIGIHGTYHKEMRKFWKNRGNTTSKLLNDTKILDYFFAECAFKQTMDWRQFRPEWNYPPRRCIENPTWNTLHLIGKNEFYKGRGG